MIVLWNGPGIILGNKSVHAIRNGDFLHCEHHMKATIMGIILMND